MLSISQIRKLRLRGVKGGARYDSVHNYSQASSGNPALCNSENTMVTKDGPHPYELMGPKEARPAGSPNAETRDAGIQMSNPQNEHVGKPAS
jgi:hypothetical protein